jgi:hypothetical protein
MEIATPLLQTARTFLSPRLRLSLCARPAMRQLDRRALRRPLILPFCESRRPRASFRCKNSSTDQPGESP